jgi:threonine/homoserine/homoserine lactone efflux protein
MLRPDFMAVVGLVVVAASTPGPNNLIVLRAATRSGMAGAMPAIAAIVLGGQALLALVSLGADAVLAAAPPLRVLLTLGGSAYLAWLGLRLASRSPARAKAADDALPSRPVALFCFQFLNPKAWVMVVTAIAAAPGATLEVAAVFAIVPAVCLTLWSALGAAMASLLSRATVALWFDRVMGALLVTSAIVLAVES